MSAASSAPPTFDELAELALAEMQRQQREQQQAIEHQIAHSPHATTVLMPGVPSNVTSSTTVGGRTVIHKAPANAASPTKALSTAAQQPSASPTTSTNPFAQTSPTHAASSSAASASTTSTSPAAPTPHDPSAVPPPPAAPAEEVHNMEIATLNETNVAALIAQQRSNAHLTTHLSTALTTQLQTIQAQHAKLAYIKSELAKLDASLTENINTLRGEIEGVGREVLYAQTEFDKREKEYLEARKQLAKVKQRKLLLTGHLDYIILTNEQDKAKKLKELEKKLFGKEDDTAADPPTTASTHPTSASSSDAGRAGSGASNGEKAGVGAAAVVAASAPPPPPAQPAFGGFGDDDSSGGGGGGGGGGPGGAGSRQSALNGQANGTGKR